MKLFAKVGAAASFGAAQLGEIIAAIGPALLDIPSMHLSDWIGAISAAGAAYATAYAANGNTMVGIVPAVAAFAAYVVGHHQGQKHAVPPAAPHGTPEHGSL